MSLIGWIKFQKFKQVNSVTDSVDPITDSVIT